MKNRAAYLVGPRKIELGDCPMPVVGDDSVGIRIRSITICGTDLHKYTSGIVPNTPLPWILGHEAAGEIYEVGKNVKNLSVGDRVAIEPGHPCGKCEYCKTGRYNLCRSTEFLAAPGYQGALREYMSYPADWVYKLPDNVSTAEGALVEPLSVGYHAVKRGEIKLGDTVVILGMGSIGFCTLLCAKAFGASRIIAVDLVESHLDMALKMGATEVVNPKECDAVEKIMELTGGVGVDMVFETAGSAITMAQTPYIVKVGGTIVMVGDIMKEVPYYFRNIYLREAKVVGVFRYRNTYPTILQMISSGRIDAKQIITSEFPLEQAQKAFETAAYDKENCIKAVIHL